MPTAVPHQTAVRRLKFRPAATFLSAREDPRRFFFVALFSCQITHVGLQQSSFAATCQQGASLLATASCTVNLNDINFVQLFYLLSIKEFCVLIEPPRFSLVDLVVVWTPKLRTTPAHTL